MKKREASKELYEYHAEICQCLANPKRLELIGALKDGELTATALAEAIGASKANTSQHLTVMREKGILKSRREGVQIFYSIANRKVLQACELMREVLIEHLKERRALAGKL